MAKPKYPYSVLMGLQRSTLAKMVLALAPYLEESTQIGALTEIDRLLKIVDFRDGEAKK